MNNATNEILTLTWTEPEFGFNAANEVFNDLAGGHLFKS